MIDYSQLQNLGNFLISLSVWISVTILVYGISYLVATRKA